MCNITRAGKDLYIGYIYLITGQKSYLFASAMLAEAFYNYLTKSKNAFSAGTDSNTPIKYPKMPDEICQIMQEENIDVSHQKVKLINSHFVNEAEQIFVMCKKDLCPDFLINSDKVIYWEIEDPYQMSIDDMRKIRNQIKVKVQSII